MDAGHNFCGGCGRRRAINQVIATADIIIGIAKRGVAPERQACIWLGRDRPAVAQPSAPDTEPAQLFVMLLLLLMMVRLAAASEYSVNTSEILVPAHDLRRE